MDVILFISGAVFTAAVAFTIPVVFFIVASVVFNVVHVLAVDLAVYATVAVVTDIILFLPLFRIML